MKRDEERAPQERRRTEFELGSANGDLMGNRFLLLSQGAAILLVAGNGKGDRVVAMLLLNVHHHVEVTKEEDRGLEVKEEEDDEIEDDLHEGVGVDADLAETDEGGPGSVVSCEIRSINVQSGAR